MNAPTFFYFFIFPFIIALLGALAAYLGGLPYEKPTLPERIYARIRRLLSKHKDEER